jgi:serine/threonine protein phosphatase 1
LIPAKNPERQIFAATAFQKGFRPFAPRPLPLAPGPLSLTLASYLPPMPRTIAIGDIHGCSRTLRKLLLEEVKLHATDRLYFIGDYIDRGPDSKGVIDFIFELRHQGFHVYALRGNHEQMILDSVKSASDYDHWLFNGGEDTLFSFGVESFEKTDQDYQQFFQSTSHIFKTKEAIYVHAGLNFENKDIYADTHAMLWIRNKPVYPEKLEGKILVHGHTPLPLEQVIRQEGNIINLDAGCVYAHREGFGYLVAYEITSRHFFFVKNCER